MGERKKKNASCREIRTRAVGRMVGLWKREFGGGICMGGLTDQESMAYDPALARQPALPFSANL